MNVWLSSSENHQWNPQEKSPETSWEAEIDKLMREQASSSDPRKRKKSFDRVQQIVAEQAPFIYLVNRNALSAVSTSGGPVLLSSNGAWLPPRRKTPASVPSFRSRPSNRGSPSTPLRVNRTWPPSTDSALTGVPGWGSIPVALSNGDGSFNDRTPGLARNSFDGPATHSLDLRFTWAVPFRKSGKLRLPACPNKPRHISGNWRSRKTLCRVVIF
jgi:hypothetical protein